MQPNQWQQQQFGYTGGAPQGYQGYGQQQQQPAFLTTQATGFPGAAQPQRPMATGYAPQQQFSAQPTGASLGLPGAGGAGGNYAFLSAPPPAGSFGARGSLSAPSGLAPQMTGFPGGGASGLLPQQTGYPGAGSGLLSQPTGMGGGLLAQPTGYAGLRAQPTGLPHDPRLQAMMQTFMPSNLSQPYSSAGVPQFNQAQQQPLQQTFQTLLQNPAANTPKIPWVLTRQEKKDYDQIFRAWDTKGEGFISGGMAQEVFGQAGLGQEDLMKIWNLADGDNRGKLNLPEFHVAMGLIYRALNGNPIPDVLPEELKPASMKDIDSTVNFMKDLLKHESNTRSDNNSPVYGNASAGGAAGSKDAKVYKHDDQATGTYRSSSRHLDRKAVRYAGEESGAEISDLRRQLQNASDNLDASSKEQSRKTEEDEEIEAEIDDVSRRVRRINEDLEYVSKGRRTQDKDEEKRKLERELLFLMHEKLPELERRQQRREEERRMEERAGVRARDRRNDTHGRYGGSGSGRDDERGDWLRGSYDRDNRGDRSRDRSRDRYDYDRRGSQSRDHDRYDRERDKRDRDRDYDRDYDRRRGGDDDRRRGSYEHDRDRRDRDVHDLAKPRAPPSPPKTASPAPEAPKAAPPPAAKAAPKPAAKPWAKMSAEERAAEARRRVAQRQAALGIAPAEDASAADDTVEERLARERKEAEEKAKAADKEQEAREEARRQRLAAVSGGDGAAAAPAAPAPPAPPAAKTPVKKPPPVAPVRKQHAPPPAPSPRAPPPAPAPPVPAVEVEDSEEAELRAAEEARKKRLAERREQLKRQQEEEEEELRREEEELAKRRAERSGKVASPAAADPPLPPFPTSPSAPAHPTGSHNPFHRKTTTDGTTPTTPASGSFNPFFRPGQAAGGAAPAAPAQRSAEPPKAPEPAPAVFVPPPPPPPPPAPPAPARVNSAPPPDDDWDVIQEKQQEDSDSSDDEYANSRHKRGALASALFGNILPSSKPASRSNSADPEATSPSTAKAAPAAALSKLGGGSAGGGGMSALLSSIQGGARLRHTETVDRSAPVGAGGVVGGDAAPPAHINAGAPVAPPSPPAAPHADVDEDDFEARNAKRQSTDWYGALAADSSHPAAQQMEHLSLEPTREEDERAVESPVGGAPDHAGAAAPSSDGPSLDDVDLGTFLRVRTLYNYETSFDGDLPFPENIVLAANPAKDPHGPWWYATLPNGKAGWIPGSFVEQFTTTPARAVYDYAAGGAEELSLTEGDALEVIDQADPDWWKVEKSGAVYIVPAAYVEIIG
ncbi:hypothetical protein Q8F55_003566 [Vanrija albida]|uniref:Actin cytoskeleton-regulatory complex protein PAN1 n=1 Tax=Vanrija albida TaxID=181172 RepID=A0ABR3Q4A0_9TREE